MTGLHRLRRLSAHLLAPRGRAPHARAAQPADAVGDPARPCECGDPSIPACLDEGRLSVCHSARSLAVSIGVKTPYKTERDKGA
jgi:hypothetical protein